MKKYIFKGLLILLLIFLAANVIYAEMAHDVFYYGRAIAIMVLLGVRISFYN